MPKEIETDISIGLSKAETDDLENLIREFREDQASDASEIDAREIRKQLSEMKRLLAKHGEVLMKFDARMKSFYEIIRLTNEKSELMNAQIKAIVETMKE